MPRIAPRPATKTAVVTEYRRAQILEAARRSFARRGLHATTVDDIARAARVAKGTVYLYYRSKDQLLKHALTEGIAGLRVETLPIIASDAPVEARLRRFMTAMIAFFDRHRDFIELCQTELSAEMRIRAKQKWGQIYAEQARAWDRALTKAAKEGAIERVNPSRAAVAIVSLAHGLAIQHLRGWTTGALEDNVAEACELLWKGLARR